MKYIAQRRDIERNERTLFVYVKDGYCRCASFTDARELEDDPEWYHTATIDPAVVLERMLNGHGDPSDELDKLQFVPANVKDSHAN